MDAPRIQYTKTSDGVKIAYRVDGDGGKTLVYMPMPLTRPMETDNQFRDRDRNWRERLARGRRVARFDFRGSGYSDRDVSDFSLDRMELDLAAVIQGLNARPVAIWAELDSGPIAIAYTAHNPDLVDALVLWCSWARDADLGDRSTWDALDTMITTNPRRYFEFLATSAAGIPASEARQAAEVLARAIDAGTLKAFLEQVWSYDVTPLLPSVKCRTMVLHPTGQDFFPARLAARLAAGIAGADLRMIDSQTIGVTPDLANSIGDLLDRFLGVELEAPRVAVTHSSGTAIILFADIVDSTGLTERLGDAAFRDKARDLDGALRAIIRDNAGTPIEGKLLGDGVLAVFTSARQAIEAALRCGEAGSHGGLPLHVGVHAGDVIREEGNVFGGAVNVAARIAAESAPGEVLVSDTVRSLARTSAGVSFEDRGEQSLKGIEEPVRLWAVREQG
ncbi:MAG: adenylate/guanylate cyclase domain-containing protein [Dehalococcoidia bacterium]